MNDGRAQRGFKGRSEKEGNSDYTVSLQVQGATWKTSLPGRARLCDGVPVCTQAVRVPREPGRAGLLRTGQGHVHHFFQGLVRGGNLISALSQGLRLQIRRRRPTPGVHPRARAQRSPRRQDCAHTRHGLPRTSQSGTAPGVASHLGWVEGHLHSHSQHGSRHGFSARRAVPRGGSRERPSWADRAHARPPRRQSLALWLARRRSEVCRASSPPPPRPREARHGGMRRRPWRGRGPGGRAR